MALRVVTGCMSMSRIAAPKVVGLVAVFQPPQQLLREGLRLNHIALLPSPEERLDLVETVETVETAAR